MTVNLTNTANFTDDATLELDGPAAVATAVIAGTTYLYVGGGDDSGVSAFRVNADGSLTNVGNVPAPAAVSSMTVVTHGGQTRLHVAGFQDQAVGSFAISNADGSLAALGPPTGLGFRPTSIASVVAGGQTYVFAASGVDNIIKGFTVTAIGGLVALGQNTVDDAAAITSAVVGGIPYLFSANRDNDGVRVFKVADNGTLTNTGLGVNDDANLELDGATALTTAVIGGTTFLFVAGVSDDGVSVFRVGADGSLANVDNVTDSESPDLRLDVVASLTTATIGDKTFLFAAGQGDDGVSVFAVDAGGVLTHVANVADGGARELDGASAVGTAVVGGATYLFAAGYFDDGVSAFLVQDNSVDNVYVVDDPSDVVDETGGSGIDTVLSSITFSLAAHDGIENLTLTGTGDINGTGNGLANHLVGNAGANILDGNLGNDLIDGAEGNDTIIGGLGLDTLTGGLGADSFLFNTALDAATNLDTILDFSHADDTILLDNAIFTKLKKDGPLKGKYFEVGKKADDKDDYIVYNKKTGELFYDKNGDHKGGAILFAVLEGSPNDLSKADFFVV